MRAATGIISNLAGLVIAFVFRNRAAEYLEENLGAVSTFTNMLEKRLLADFQNTAWLTVPIIQQGIASLHQKIGEFAFLVIAAFCFLVLYIVSSQIFRVWGFCFARLIHLSYLDRINRLGGAALVILQNLIIMGILSWMALTLLTKSSELGIERAVEALNYMQESLLFPWLTRLVAFLLGLIKSSA